MLLNIFIDLFTYLKYILSGDSANLIKMRELKALYKVFKPSKYRYITRDKKITNNFLQKIYLLFLSINDFKILLDTTIFSSDEKRAQIYLNHFIESFLSEDIRAKKEKFTKDMIWKKIMEAENVSKTVKGIEDEFIMYKSFLNKKNLPRLEEEYYLMYKLNSLATFNFELFFSKFDPYYTLPSQPNYAPVLGDEIIVDVEDLYFLITSLPKKVDLTNAFEKLYMKNEGDYKSLAKKSQQSVNKIFKMISDDLSPRILISLCKYIKEDIKYTISIQPKFFSILDRYRKDIETVFMRNKEFVLEKYSEKSLQQDVESLFNGKHLLNINGFTDTLKKAIETNNLDPISGIMALKITKTFIMEIYEKSIKDTMNTLILEAFFSEKEYQMEFSNVFFAANELRDIVSGCEELLSGSGKNSFSHLEILIKNYKMDNKVAENKITMQVDLINERIRHCNEKCANVLYKLANNVYNIIQDYKGQKAIYVTNIKAIKGSQNKEFINQLAKAYNDIAKYIKIIKNFIIVKSSVK